MEETGLSISSIKLIGIKECFYNNTHYKDRHFLFMDYTCKADTLEVTLNNEAEEYVWSKLSDLHTYELGGFTESLFNKLINQNEKMNTTNIYYNYE